MDKKKNPIVGPVTDLLTEGIAQRVADLLRPQLDRAQTPLRLLSVNATGRLSRPHAVVNPRAGDGRHATRSPD